MITARKTDPRDLDGSEGLSGGKPCAAEEEHSSGKQPAMDRNAPEKGKMDGVLPSALVCLRVRNVLTGFLVILFAAGFAFAEREWRFSLTGLFGVWFVLSGITLEKRYRTGKIIEKMLICTSVRRSPVKNTVSVGFRTDENLPVFYHYEVGGRCNADAFYPNGMYLIYFAEDTPSQLMAWTQI